MIFIHSAHVNIRELALACLNRLVFFGGDDMRNERDLIIENSIWEQVQKKWDAEWEDDPDCMFETCGAGENLADIRAAKKGKGKKKLAAAGSKKVVKKSIVSKK
jgi:hypothetical protein